MANEPERARGVLDVTWVGHATVRLRLDGTTILTDPALLPRIGGLLRRVPLDPGVAEAHVDAVLISHAHHDHLDLPSLRRLGHRTPIIVSRGAGGLLTRAGFTQVTEVEVGDRIAIGGLRVTAVPAQHAGRRLPFGPWAVAIGYLVEGTRRVYFAGDTALFDEMADIGAGMDLALIPVGGWGPRLRGGHLDPLTAAKALRMLQPRWALPIHWGTFWPAGMSRVGSARFSEPGREFVVHATQEAPGVEVVLLRPGEQRRLAMP